MSGGEPTREQLEDWLTANCGTGLPHGDAKDQAGMLHGLAYVLRQIEGMTSYKVNIGQCNSATSALRMALEHFAREALTTPPARTYAEGDTETQWEVWEDDLMVASSTDEADARHYLAVYSQDGPVRLVKAVTVRTPCDSDSSGEAGKTGTGLTEGNSAGPQGIAHTAGEPS